jgi:pimeloyl-ACP methyl ester carboxylesterase
MRAALLTVVLLSGCAGLRTVPLPPQAERHRARTSDGWELSMVRYKAVGTSTGRPIIFCHGIAANDRNMDLDDDHSIARWFAAHGREAWTLSLRGTGGSDAASPREGRPDDSDFDAFWKEDVPAAVAKAIEVSGSPKVDWVGHSMGGMVLYAYLAQGGDGIGAAATLGSPTRLDFGTGTDRLLATVSPLFPRSGAFPSALGALLAAPFQGAVDDGPFQRLFYDPANTRTDVWQRLMAYGTADVSFGVARQLTGMMRDGKFTSADGKADFRAAMARMQTPVMVVAGRRDHIALTPAVRDAYRAWGGPKEWLLVSVANGARAEYGHMDLVVGEHAPRDVWAPVLEFLNRHQAERAIPPAPLPAPAPASETLEVSPPR